MNIVYSHYLFYFISIIKQVLNIDYGVKILQIETKRIQKPELLKLFLFHLYILYILLCPFLGFSGGSSGKKEVSQPSPSVSSSLGQMVQDLGQSPGPYAQTL